MFPVIADAASASRMPSELKLTNAFVQDRYGTNWCESLVDELLTHSVFPRRQPQVFISYRRIDSERVAQQLHDEFTRLGYLVFLDTVSIRATEDFQHELMWRLNDTDLVILLASPRLELSEWVLREVDFAMGANIGIALVRWPTACFASGPADAVELPFTRRNIVPDAFQPLELADLDIDATEHDDIHGRYEGTEPVDHRLTGAALERLVAMVTKLRAVALRDRQIDLLGYVLDRERRAGHEPRHLLRPGDLHVKRGHQEHLVRVFPFRPEPVMLHGAALDSKELHAVAVYPENYPNDARARALQWVGQREGFGVEPVFGAAGGGDDR